MLCCKPALFLANRPAGHNNMEKCSLSNLLRCQTTILQATATWTSVLLYTASFSNNRPTGHNNMEKCFAVNLLFSQPTVLLWPQQHGKAFSFKPAPSSDYHPTGHSKMDKCSALNLLPSQTNIINVTTTWASALL